MTNKKAPTKTKKPTQIETAYQISRVDYLTFRLDKITLTDGKTTNRENLKEDLKGIVLAKLQLEVAKDA